MASVIGDGTLTILDPPQPSDIPTISAIAALTPVDGGGNVMHLQVGHPNVQPVVRLARFTSGFQLNASNHRLVWAVIFNDVQLSDTGGPAPTGPGYTAPKPRPAVFGVAIITVDANTGHAIEEHDFGPPLSSSQLR